MGYTHYWDSPAFSNQQWDELVATLRQLQELTGDLLEVNVYDNSFDLNAQNEGDQYESFCLHKSGTKFNFCKTACRPYDKAVVAMLIAARKINPEFSWRSDGRMDDGDFDKGIQLAVQLFEGENVTPYLKRNR